MQEAVEGDLGRQFTAGAARSPGVPTAGKSGTAELGGTRRAALVVHRLRAGREPDRSRSPCSSSAADGAGSARRRSPGRCIAALLRAVRDAVTTEGYARRPDRPRPARTRDAAPHRPRAPVAGIARSDRRAPAHRADRAGVIALGSPRCSRSSRCVVRRRRAVPRRHGRDRLPDGAVGRRTDPVPRLTIRPPRHRTNSGERTAHESGTFCAPADALDGRARREP